MTHRTLTPTRTPMDVRPVRLPDEYYLPRLLPDGSEVRDVVPWDGATSYVTDGARYGIQWQDGTVAWLGTAPQDEDLEQIDNPTLELPYPTRGRDPVPWRADLVLASSILAMALLVHACALVVG